jgi:amino acid transporter
MATDNAPAPQVPATPALQANAVGLGRVIAYTAAMIGPAASIALGLVAAISFAGYATPLVVLLSFIAALCASVTVGQFAKRLPSAGSFFTYNSTALGPSTGYVTGHLLAFAYIVFVPAGAAASGTFFAQFFHDAFGVNISQNLLLVLVVIFIAILAYEGISTSSSVDLIVLTFELAVIVALAVTILAKGGPGPAGWHLFDPGNSLHHRFSDLSLGMVYTVVIFTGFESGAVLAEESRNPRRIIPRGLLGAVSIVGLFYLFVSYSEMTGVAPGKLNAFVSSPSQLNLLTGQYWSSSVLWLMDLVVALSTLAFTISTFNSGARLIFAMGRERMLPRQLSYVSKRRTPHIAILAIAVLAIVVALPMSLNSGGFLAFAYLGGIAGIAFILVYISACVALIVIVHRKWRRERRIFTHIVVPVIAGGLFCIPLVGTFYPVPSSPYDILPYIAVGWLALGIVVAVVLKRTRPSLLQAIGRIFVEAEPDDGQVPVALRPATSHADAGEHEPTP